MADSVALDDGPVREALLALTTRQGAAGRERIAYGDLGVEQLGGVYERVLDFEPVVTRGSGDSAAARSARKATGSFYTPRALTEFVVRRALAPLVRDAAPEAILALRVLDPAMGSGAFLVAACRYLAAAYERALVHTRDRSRRPTSPSPSARGSGGRSPSGACSASTSIRWPSSSAGCRSGSRHWPPIGR